MSKKWSITFWVVYCAEFGVWFDQWVERIIQDSGSHVDLLDERDAGHWTPRKPRSGRYGRRLIDGSPSEQIQRRIDQHQERFLLE